jgi:hypothetical protein
LGTAAHVADVAEALVALLRFRNIINLAEGTTSLWGQRRRFGSESGRAGQHTPWVCLDAPLVVPSAPQSELSKRRGQEVASSVRDG